MQRISSTLLATVLLVAGLAACGSDDDGGATAAGDGDTSTTAADTSETSAAPEGGAAPDAGAAPEVDIVDFAFAPEELVVAAGTTVTWTNKDDATHSVAVSALDEESDDMAKGDTFEITYDEAGEYPYVCGIHNYMKGTVTVE